MNKKRSIVVISEIDNVVYNYTNYYLEMIDYIGDFLFDNFGVNKKEYLEMYFNCIGSAISGFDDYAGITYSILKTMFNKNFFFDTNVSKSLLCSIIRTKINSARNKYLCSNPGVISSMDRMRKSGVIFIGLTNSSANLVEHRLKVLKLDKYFDTVYSIKSQFISENVEESSDSFASVWFQSSSNNLSSISCEIIGLPALYSKPSIRGLQRVIEDYSLNNSSVFVVGSSIELDIIPARLMGLKTVFMDYNPKISNITLLKDMIATLDLKTVRRSLRLFNNKKASEIKYDYKIRSFHDLESILLNKFSHNL